MLLRTVFGLLAVAAAGFAIHDDNVELLKRARDLMRQSPLIDTHIDLPQIMRSLSRRPMEEIPKIAKRYPGHVDIPRMMDGSLGAGFFSVWTPCPVSKGIAEDPNALRDALEILDLIQNMVSQQSEHLQFARSSADILRAHEQGKIAALIGVEGTHFLGNSLSTVRLLAQAGARYLTLTHICHSAFASSNGGGGPMKAVHPGNGLTDLGRELIKELNRLGIMVDLSHTSDETAIQAIALSKAPVVWTHSGSRSIWDHPRNIPDAILSKIGTGPGRRPGIVHSVFYPPFIGPVDSANTSCVADHIEYIARNVGKKHVGIGSDFDGMYSSVVGLEDASSYPNLVAEMLRRNWTDDEVKDLMGRNLLRVMDEVDAVSERLLEEMPSVEVHSLRKDLPARWGGLGDTYFPYEVRTEQRKLLQHDEL